MKEKDKVGLAVNIIVVIVILAVGSYLVNHFYNTGYNKGTEAGYKKGRVAGWNEGYEEARQTMMEFVLESARTRFQMPDDSSNRRIKVQLDDIERKINDAELERQMRGLK